VAARPEARIHSPAAPCRAILFRHRFILALILVLALALTGCASASGAPSGSATPATPATIPLPPMLGAYHIFTTDLLTGAAASLGAQTVHVSSSVHGLGLSPDGQTLYVSDVAGNRVVAYDIAGGRLTQTHTVKAGAYPVHMVETPDQRLLFVSNFYGASVSVISTQTWQVIKTIATPPGPHSVVIAPNGHTVYVACYLGHAVVALDVATQAIVGTIDFPAQTKPYGLAISPDGRYLYASDNFGGWLYTADTAARRVITSVPIGKSPALIARSPDAHTLYVANGGSHSVSVVDIATNPAAPRVTATVPVAGFPHGLAVSPDGRYVVVAGTTSGELSVIQTLSDQVIATISGLRYPNDVAITAA
jgi:YVTN family beta-propeller protein